jgi:GDP-L-fucose synthase
MTQYKSSSPPILVTGASGFLGRAVLHQLEMQGIGPVVTPSSADFDLTVVSEVAAMFAKFEPAVVIHLAAQVGGIGANRRRPADLYLSNLLMGTHVIDQARRAGTPKTVIVGTICSYPKYTPVPFQESSLWDGYPEETNAPYGIAKKAHLVQAQANRAQWGQNVIYLMPTNLYGPGDKFNPSISHVIPALIKKCVDARESGADEIVVWGSGRASREFLYVEDAARGIVAATESYDGAEPVNLGSGEEVRIDRLVEMVAEVTGFGGRFRWDSSQPDGQPRRQLDCSAAEHLFGFRASTPLPVGLAETVRWYLANRREAELREG